MNKAKNVIFFLGDGMGPTTVTAARFYLAQSRGKKIEETGLAWEDFPAVGLSKVTQFAKANKNMIDYIIKSCYIT